MSYFVSQFIQPQYCKSHWTFKAVQRFVDVKPAARAPLSTVDARSPHEDRETISNTLIGAGGQARRLLEISTISGVDRSVRWLRDSDVICLSAEIRPQTSS
jgi:hypothetical protein